MTIGIFLCSFLILKKARQINLGFEEMIVVMAISLGAALFGAGLLYVLVSYPSEVLLDKIVNGEFDFLSEIGSVYYGGLIGGILGAIVALRWQKLDVKKVEQCVVPFLPLGHSIGRLGCLLAGCCYGFEYTGPLAVRSAFVIGKTLFPIQGVEALLNLKIMAILLLYIRKNRPSYHILALYLILYSIVRFSLEFFRGDLIRGSFLFLSTSQWISVILLLVGIVVLCRKQEQ